MAVNEMPTREDLHKLTILLEKPVDFPSLERRGDLIKKGRRYYTPNIHRLPKHVTAKIIETTACAQGGCFVRFDNKLLSKNR